MRSRRPSLGPRLISVLIAALMLPGCLWLPDWPIPDKVDPDPPENLLPFAHCSPRPNKWEPIVVGDISGPRSVHCRIRGADSVLWTIDTEVDDDDPILGLDPALLEDSAPVQDGPMILARDVESIDLYRSTLPWSPRPYAAILRAAVQLPGGEVTTKRWPVLVVPGADELTSVGGLPPLRSGNERGGP